jgi:hypothetical protein
LFALLIAVFYQTVAPRVLCGQQKESAVEYRNKYLYLISEENNVEKFDAQTGKHLVTIKPTEKIPEGVGGYGIDDVLYLSHDEMVMALNCEGATGSSTPRKCFLLKFRLPDFTFVGSLTVPGRYTAGTVPHLRLLPDGTVRVLNDTKAYELVGGVFRSDPNVEDPHIPGIINKDDYPLSLDVSGYDISALEDKPSAGFPIQVNLLDDLDGSLFLLFGNGNALILDKTAKRIVTMHPGFEPYYSGVLLVPGGKQVLIEDKHSGKLILLDSSTGKVLRTVVDPHMADPLANVLAITPSGVAIIYGYDSKNKNYSLFATPLGMSFDAQPTRFQGSGGHRNTYFYADR